MIDSVSSMATDAAVAELMECLVIGYAYQPRQARFVFVSDFPRRPRGGDRSFLALEFSQVSTFERMPGVRSKLQHIGERYAASEDAAPLVVQAIRFVEATPPRRRIEFWLGPAFGGLGFEFDAVEAKVREARAEQHADQVVYRDIVSGEALEFLNPFPGLMPDPLAPKASL